MSDDNQTVIAGNSQFADIDRLNVGDDVKQFLRDLVAITHNNSLRSYEHSCLVDGLLYLVRDVLEVPHPVIHNTLQITTAIKEYSIQTGVTLSFEEARLMFAGEEFLWDTNLLKADVRPSVAEFHNKNKQEANNNVH